MRRVPVVLLLALLGTAERPCHAVVTHNRLAGNRLAGNRLAGNRLAGNRLAGNRLSTNGLEADMSTAGELLSTPEGRELYAYVISCALPSGTTIEATIPGAPDSGPGTGNDTPYTCTSERCVFGGGINLAPRWINRKLTRTGQRWVSACLFARVNLYDTAESISLRGSHEALAVFVDEAELYPLEEGAFYGQAFTDLDQPIGWFACRGEAQAAGESGGLILRDCTEPDPNDPAHTLCGFNFAGDCASYSPASPAYACQVRDAARTFYDKCHERPGPGKWPRIKRYREVITVFVAK